MSVSARSQRFMVPLICVLDPIELYRCIFDDTTREPGCGLRSGAVVLALAVLVTSAQRYMQVGVMI